MSCCSGKGCDEFFTDRVARRDADATAGRASTRNAQRLVDARLPARDRRTHGARGRRRRRSDPARAAAGRCRARTDDVELSPAYEPYAAELLQRPGSRAASSGACWTLPSRRIAVDPADVVVLHKVVCCYPDYEALVGAAAAHATHQLGSPTPGGRGGCGSESTAANLLERLRRRTFRAYVHPPAAIIAIARSHGLEPTTSHRGAVWEFCGLERISGRAPAQPGSPLRSQTLG